MVTIVNTLPGRYRVRPSRREGIGNSGNTKDTLPPGGSRGTSGEGIQAMYERKGTVIERLCNSLLEKTQS